MLSNGWTKEEENGVVFYTRPVPSKPRIKVSLADDLAAKNQRNR